MDGRRESGGPIFWAKRAEIRIEVSEHIKRAGPYLLGPRLNNMAVNTMPIYLARKERTNEFFTLKVLTLKKFFNKGTIKARAELHAEYALLSLLKGQKGVVQQHGFFKDTAVEVVEIDGKLVKTGKMVTRIFLVLDCITPHDFSPCKTLTGLQDYVYKENKFTELETMELFLKIVEIVQRLHEQNIVHRDLKLGNMAVDRDTKEITIGNFFLGKQLTSEDEIMFGQRGSPAYASPELICAGPYLGKPLDVWALGVILYLMLYKKFPFSAEKVDELFAKVKAIEYEIPREPQVSAEIVQLFGSIFVHNQKERITCAQVYCAVKNFIMTRRGELISGIDANQVVPDSAPLQASQQGAEGDDDEPPIKKAKVSQRIIGMGSTTGVTLVRVNQGTQPLAVGELWKVHAIYESGKPVQQAAASSTELATGATTHGTGNANNTPMGSSGFAVPRPPFSRGTKK